MNMSAGLSFKDFTLLQLSLALIVFIVLPFAFVKRRLRQRAINELMRQHGCLPPPRLSNHRPFGVDRVEEIFRAVAEGSIMSLFLTNVRKIGYTQDQILLGRQSYGTIDPANLEAILSTNFKDWGFGPRREITFPMFGDGIFTQEGDAWRYSREVLRPHLQHKQYADCELLRQSVDDLIDVLPDEGVVDLQPLFFRLTLDTTTKFLFGESVRSLKAPDSSGEQIFADAFNLAQDYVANRFRLLGLYWLFDGPKFRDACRKVHEFADQIIDRNLAKDSEKEKVVGEKQSFLRLLSADIPDRAALRGQIINMLTAGRDTTACLLSWAFFLLVRHPQKLQRLRDEIAQHCPEGTALNRDILKGMPYLQNVIKETLRLYPSVPINVRTSLKDTVLPTGGGPDGKSPVFIPKDMDVVYSPYSLHRRAELYGLDADIFRPERWDEDMPMKQDPVLSRWGYLPFNGGPRICLGMDFALVEGAYVIVRLLQRFESITLPEGTIPEVVGTEKQTITLVVMSADGCKVNLAGRR